MKHIAEMWKMLTGAERRLCLFLLVFSLLVSAIQGAGVVSIMPFMSVLTDLNKIHEGGYLTWVYHACGSPGEKTFLQILGLASFVLFACGSGLNLASVYLNARFINGRSLVLSRRVLIGYLQKPYEFYLNSNSADIIQNIVTQVAAYVSGCLNQAITAISHAILATIMIIVVIVPDPATGLAAALLLGGGYGIAYLQTRKELYRIGKVIRDGTAQRHKAVSELVGGIKEIMLLGRTSEFVRQFMRPAHETAVLSTKRSLLQAVPPAFIQTLMMGAMLFVLLVYTARQSDIKAVIPLISLYAAAAFRLLPTVTAAFKAFSTLRSGQAITELIKNLLEQLPPSKSIPISLCETDGELKEKIIFDQVSFCYGAAKKTVLQDMNLEIQRGDRVAFIGETGCGKTTAVDLLCGLLQPTDGKILVDGKSLADPETLRRWQSQIGYVSQHVFLCDDTIARNIALGVPEAEICQSKLESAACIAQLAEFILEELPLQFQTRVGERGVRLSGGQRQRIGIARALYHNPSVLVLDEATSALDDETERKVIKALEESQSCRTVIMIAHRLTTIRNCNKVIEMKKQMA